MTEGSKKIRRHPFWGDARDFIELRAKGHALPKWQKTGR